MVELPAVGSTRPSNIRKVVVLPAPFGPRNPVMLPSATSKLRSSTASTVPKRLVRPLIWMDVIWPLCADNVTGASALSQVHLSLVRESGRYRSLSYGGWARITVDYGRPMATVRTLAGRIQALVRRFPFAADAALAVALA